MLTARRTHAPQAETYTSRGHAYHLLLIAAALRLRKASCSG